MTIPLPHHWLGGFTAYAIRHLDMEDPEAVRKVLEGLNERFMYAQDNFEAVSSAVPFFPFPGSDYVPAWHTVGDSGEPAFQANWRHDGGAGPDAGFFKDPSGFVHLRGVVDETGDGGSPTIFTLPEPYRPSGDDEHWFSQTFLDSAAVLSSEFVVIHGDTGAVEVNRNAAGAAYWDFVPLNGIHFYAP